MLERIRRSRFTKVIVCFLSISFLTDVFNLNQILALTGGPKQPENQGFAPIGLNDMVDPFTGDFTYNIPLFDVGGYPMNLVYNSGVSMDQEAGWCGLGWSITPGVVNRNMRSLPDDFSGDEIKKEFNLKDSYTYSVTGGAKVEIFGFFGIGANLGVSYNNYTKYDVELSANPSLKLTASNGMGLNAGLGISASSSNGAGISPNVGLSYSKEKSMASDYKVFGGASASVGCSYNSRAGLQALNVGLSFDAGMVKDQTRLNYPSIGSSCAYSFASPTYTPQISMPMQNNAFSFSGTIGGDIFGIHPAGSFAGSYGVQSLATRSRSIPAFGYMNLQNNYAYGNKVMLDFNREKDGSFFQNVPNLPLTNLTYDVFSINGQGVNGTYRARRGDVGVLFDDETSNQSSSSMALGVEIGFGNLNHAGFSCSVNTVNGQSGKWTTSRNFAKNYRFQGYTNNDLFEPYYFKQAGEKVCETDSNFFPNVVLGYDPIQVPISKSGITTDWLNSGYKTNQRNARDRRNQTMTILNASEASMVGTEKTIRSHAENNFSINKETGNYESFQDNLIQRINPNNRKAHHISEITTYKTDGTRYIFGIPEYNNEQSDVTFAVDGTRNSSLEKGTITYDSGDNTQNNNKGLDNYFNKSTMPPYAHSFLLTEILSPDYVDADGISGPSMNDLGNYTKFNYSRINDNYQWRTPYNQKEANYNEGLKSLENKDDKGSYIYGKKEVWYLHSIETKTQVAEFVLGNRSDSYGVGSEDGGLNEGSNMRRLEMIKIYSLQDKKLYGDNATPIKTVHFEYYDDNDGVASQLCPGIDNNRLNNSSTKKYGKLTLKRVYFTYGNSLKSKLNTYEFKYGEYRTKDGSKSKIINPSYHLKAMDRWGNYKPAMDASGLYSAEYPYSIQDQIPGGDNFYDGWRKYMADEYATAWTLSSIKLPSGGLIKMDYEADDYAYVQNKRAMRMFKVVGASPVNRPVLTSNLYSGGQPYLRLYVKPEKDYPNNNYSAQFIKDYLSDENGQSLIATQKELYFRFNVNFKGKNDYVSGYSPISQAGLTTINGVQYGYIDLQDFSSGGETYNPISVSSWNFAKLNMPDVAYDKPEPSGSILSVAVELAYAVSTISEFFESYYHSSRKRSFCNAFDTNKSWVRLYKPDGIKKGGGVRVKRLTINDQWNSLTNSDSYDNFDYGQEYEYTTTDGSGKTISSGVASYEPQIGGDENPFKTPISYSRENKMAPNDKFYIETPLGESFFPSPVVGYSKVTVKNLQHDNVTRNATGKIVHEFYTAKDFPTITKETSLAVNREKSNGLRKLLKFNVKDFVTTSQGYAVELNDMHGKAKADWVYQEGKAAASTGTEYKYNTTSPTQLCNEVDVINKNDVISKKTVGVDYDFAIDMREQKTTNVCSGANFNTETFLALFFPIVVPIIIPQRTSEKTRFRSVVTTKVINRGGLLKEKIAYEDGAKVSTENLLYDEESGEVLLTGITNQYTDANASKNDKIYSFTYPAYWGYDVLSSVYKTAGSSLSRDGNRFTEGDIIPYQNTPVWVTSTLNGKIQTVLQKDGTNVSLGSLDNYVKILKPGRRNQQAMSIGTVVTSKNPISGSSLSFDPKSVLNASASEYTDTAKIYCDCDVTTINPFVNGTRGNWKPKRSYSFLADRKQTFSNNNTNIRYDGYFTRFNPFWTPNNGNDWNKNYNNWTFTSEVTLYNPFGGELENRDALGIYSSATYGYNFTVPISITKNSQYTLSGFDNFEDYGLERCDRNHFNFEEEGASKIVSGQAHTGKNCIKLNKGESVKFVRQIQKCPNQ